MENIKTNLIGGIMLILVLSMLSQPVIAQESQTINFNEVFEDVEADIFAKIFLFFRLSEAGFNVIFEDFSDDSSDNDEDTDNDSDEDSEDSCTTEWDCTGWSDCVDGVQTRTCYKKIVPCVADGEKPVERKTCTTDTINIESNRIEGENKNGLMSKVTGAVIGTLGTTGFAVAVTFLLLVVASSITIVFMRKRHKR